MSLAWPFPGLWLGKWGKEGGERSSSSWTRREPEPSCPGLKQRQEAAAQIHNVLPNPSPLIQLSAGQTSQIFLCVRVHVKTLMRVNPGSREHVCTHVDV